MKTPLTPEKRSATAGKDDKLIAMMQDRSFKAKAPEAIDPTKKPMTPEESVKLFLESRAKSEDFIKTTQGTIFFNKSFLTTFTYINVTTIKHFSIIHFLITYTTFTVRSDA